MQQHQQATPATAAPAPAVTSPRPTAPAPKESAPTGVKRRGGPGGLSKVCGVSPELQAIVGEPTMARTEIVKQLWAYIRKNNLQDPSNKRKIICNDELRLVFETDCTDMFKMNKLLAKHIIPLESTKDSGSDSKKLKTAPATELVSSAEANADQYPVAISDALAKFFGTGERAMLQSDALRRVWDYIKSNRLEDPMNSTVILCDAKLQQLFGCESISALGVSEMLSRHLFKPS
ncbi:upstream activation factor subunit spp27-like [Ananas comosus]|uniref:Upstream activation factor subunit spp27-like n=3 Tax=Ananas comosus TaxID=4615 RepID=A0A6P5EIU5_ANACO|nr:upstream activation factor subunit spp27-like [Ananas comosus]